MADSTQLNSLKLFKWERPELSNPTINAPIDADTTTLTFSTPPRDEDDAIITGDFLGGMTNKDSYTETYYVPAGGMSADGLTATGVIRGIDPAGLDYAVGNADFAAAFEQGDPTYCNISAVLFTMMRSAIQGNIATSGTGITIGTEPGAGGETVTIYRTTTAGVKLGFIRWEVGGEVEYSDDGIVWVANNDTTASVLAKVSAADTTAGYLGTKIEGRGGITDSIGTPAGDERVLLDIDLTANTANITAGLLATVISDVTATTAEINQALDGVSANVTDTALNTMTAGVSSNADAYHTHKALGAYEFTSGEAIDGSTTPQHLCQAGASNRSELTVHLGGVVSAWELEADGVADLDFGDVDARTQRAQSFTETDALAGTITVRKVRVFLQKTGAPVDNVTIEIQGNDTNKPDNTPITNGTSVAIAGGDIETTHEWTTFTFATPPTITSGTKYWFVVKRSAANDAAKYYSVGNEAANNYASHGSSYYTASITTWSAEDVDADLIFQVEYGKDYGSKVYKLDADNVNLGCNYVGTTEDDVAVDAAIDVIPPSQLQDSFTGLTASTPYYASGTAGGSSVTEQTAVDTVSMIIGKARSTTELFLLDGLKSFHKTLDILDLGEGAASDGYITIITGFRPTDIKLRYHANETGAGNEDGFTFEQSYNGTVAKGGIMATYLDDNGVVITAKSAILPTQITAARPDLIVPHEIFDNGMVLRVKTDATETQFDNIQIEAKGY